MKRIFIDADPEELIAWLAGKPVAAPQPPANRTTKSFICTVMSRDAIVLPAAIFSNVRSEP